MLKSTLLLIGSTNHVIPTQSRQRNRVRMGHLVNMKHRNSFINSSKCVQIPGKTVGSLEFMNLYVGWKLNSLNIVLLMPNKTI